MVNVLPYWVIELEKEVAYELFIRLYGIARDIRSSIVQSLTVNALFQEIERLIIIFVFYSQLKLTSHYGVVGATFVRRDA